MSTEYTIKINLTSRYINPYQHSVFAEGCFVKFKTSFFTLVLS